MMAAQHEVIPQLYYSGAWQDLGPDTLTGEKIVTERGYAEEGALRPSKLTFVLNNPADTYRPTNPASPIYDGKGGRNIWATAACDFSIRATGEVVSWQPDQTVDFNVGPPLRGRRWVGIVAEGILRRIGQWDDPIQSPMRRRLGTLSNLTGYWPLEDPSASIRLSNAVPAGRQGVLTGAQLAGGPGAAGSEPVVKIAAVSNIGGSFRASTTTGWGISWTAKLNTAPASPSGQVLMSWRTHNGMRFELSANNVPQFGVKVMKDDVVLTDTVFGTGGLDTTQWTCYRVKATQVGGNVQLEPAMYRQGATTTFGATFSFAGSVSTLYDWQVNGNALTADALYGHVYGLAGDTSPMLAAETLAAFNGHVGERAATRFLRLCSEQGVAAALNGTASTTMPMGVQRSDTLLKLLEEIERTEDGLIYDRRDLVELVLRTRRTRYNQTVAAALTYPTHINPPFAETIDDQGITNVMTARQRDGGEAVAAVTTGPMVPGNAGSGLGTYRGGIEVNLDDENLLDDIAWWRLNRGTVAAPRYPTVVIDLENNPGLTATVNALEIGDRITITGREPDPLDCFLLGIHEEIQSFRRIVTLTLRPNGAFNIGVYDGAASRYDSSSTTLAAPATTTATSLSLTTVLRADCWSTTGVPYSLTVGGERVTVTAMSAPAGSGPYTQTATVTRSANGVVKAQATGTAVRVHAPVRYGL